jgi:RHS repeat-associated protein
MVMPGRKYPAASGVYRYGFNGKENDNEVKGEGNQQDYGMRIYDPRLMRFLSVDPISNDYPELTPYQFASNRPIDGIDQDGLEYAKANMHSDATIVRHNSDPHIAQEQIIAAPQRRNAVIAQDVQRKINTQARSVLTKYKEPDVAQKQRNASLQKNHDAKTVPENHWTRNKHLNNLSERVAEPMAEMAVGEGLGKASLKGVSLILERYAAKSEMQTVYRVFGGDSRVEGFSWTPVNPNSVKDFRNLAGLPSGGASGSTNTAEFMIKGRVNIKDILKSHPAEPLDGNIGGLPEFKIDPSKVKITSFKVLKP